MTPRLDVGNVLSRVFELYGNYLTTLLGIGAIIFVPLGILSGILQSSGGIILALVASVVGLIGTGLFVGSVTRLVEDVNDGRLDASLGGLVSSVTPVLTTVVLTSVAASIGEGIGLVLCILPGLFLITAWAVVIPVVVIEGAGIGQAFGRSWALVKGNFWQVLAVIVLFFVIQVVASAVLGAILLAISDTTVLRVIASIVAQLLVAPLSALAAAVVYFQLARATVPAEPAFDAPPPPPPAPPAPNVGL